MKLILKLFFVLAMLSGTHYSFAQTTPASSQPAAIKQDTSVHYTYKIINSVNNTYGYDVTITTHGKKLFNLHQPNIPGMPGNEGFKTKASAEKVAQLAIRKMKKGEVPPTITPDELKKLKAIK